MQPTLFYIPGINLPIKGYGLMMMIGFLSGIYLAARRASRVKANPDLILNAGFLALIFGVLGARIFFVIHHWEKAFATQKNIFQAVILGITKGGLEFYGGLIGAMLAVVGYLYLKRVSVRMYLDIIAPSVMWGLAITRLGCFLNGCCWGGLCDHAWAVQFPHGSPAQYQQWVDRRISLPAELLVPHSERRWGPMPAELASVTPEIEHAPRLAYEKAKAKLDDAVARGAKDSEIARLKKKVNILRELYDKQEKALGSLRTATQWYGLTPSELHDMATGDRYRSMPVHPAQIYAFINAMLLSILLATVLRYRKRHGVVFLLMFSIYPIARIILETVRVDNALDTGGLTVSQGVSVGMLVAAGLGWLWLYRQPLRSPKAIPFTPPPDPIAPTATA